MLPVEPSRTRLIGGWFRSSIARRNIRRESEEEGVEAIEDAAVSGDEVGGVLDVHGALEEGLDEVAEL